MSQTLTATATDPLETTPLGPPPPGETSNFVNPETRQAEAIGVTCMCLVLMLTAVGARFYARGFVVKKWGLDDLFCGIAAAFATAYIGMAIANFASGTFAVHAWDIPLSKFEGPWYYNMFIAVIVIYPLAQWATKLTLLVLIERIFSRYRSVRILVWTGVAVLCIFYTITIVLTCVYCAPLPSETSNETVSSAVCQKSGRDVSIAQAGFSIASDVYLITIPVPYVLKLQSSRRRKFQLIALFLFGSLGTAMTIPSLYYRVTYDSDPYGGQTTGYIWQIYEVNVAIMCACLPCIHVLGNTSFMQNLRSKGGSTWNRLLTWTRGSGSSRTASTGNNPNASHSGHGSSRRPSQPPQQDAQRKDDDGYEMFLTKSNDMAKRRDDGHSDLSKVEEV